MAENIPFALCALTNSKLLKLLNYAKNIQHLSVFTQNKISRVQVDSVLHKVRENCSVEGRLDVDLFTVVSRFSPYFAPLQ